MLGAPWVVNSGHLILHHYRIGGEDRVGAVCVVIRALLYINGVVPVLCTLAAGLHLFPSIAVEERHLRLANMSSDAVENKIAPESTVEPLTGPAFDEKIVNVCIAPALLLRVLC